MMRRTPLRQKRATPRRTAPDRVQHVRTKAKAGAAPDAAEKAHIKRVAALGCLVCGAPATVHHVSARVTGGRIARSHKCVTPLCPRHHMIQHGPRESVEALGHAGFYFTYAIDLHAEGVRLWRESYADPP